MYSLRQHLFEPGVVLHLVSHWTVHQHIHSFVRILLSFFFFHIRNALVKLTVATLKVHELLIPVGNVSILSADNGREVFELLHLIEILVTLLINCLEILVVNHLHVAEGLFQVCDISMAWSKRVSQLLSHAREIRFSCDSELSFCSILVAQEKVFLSTYGLLSLGDESAQSVKLLFKLSIFLLFGVGLVCKVISFPLKLVYLGKEIIEARNGCSWSCSCCHGWSSHWLIVLVLGLLCPQSTWATPIALFLSLRSCLLISEIEPSLRHDLSPDVVRNSLWWLAVSKGWVLHLVVVPSRTLGSIECKHGVIHFAPEVFVLALILGHLW